LRRTSLLLCLLRGRSGERSVRCTEAGKGGAADLLGCGTTAFPAGPDRVGAPPASRQHHRPVGWAHLPSHARTRDRNDRTRCRPGGISRRPRAHRHTYRHSTRRADRRGGPRGARAPARPRARSLAVRRPGRRPPRTHTSMAWSVKRDYTQIPTSLRSGIGCFARSRTAACLLRS
jgi:hypothetical protein